MERADRARDLSDKRDMRVSSEIIRSSEVRDIMRTCGSNALLLRSVEVCLA